MSRIVIAAVMLLASAQARAEVADAGTGDAGELLAVPTVAVQTNLHVDTSIDGGALSSSDGGTAAANGEVLGLRDLQTIARSVDPRALIAYAQFENAQGKRDEADWIWFPNFQTTIAAAGPTPEARLIGGDNDALEDITPGTRQGFLGGEWGAAVQINMSTQMPIYTFGKIDAGKSAAAHGVEARAALLAAQRNQAAFDVARAYWSYQTTRDAQKSINDMRDRLDQARKQAQQLLADKSDQITATDAARLDYISDEVEAQSTTAIANQHLAEAALKLLVGRMPEEPLGVARETVPVPPLMPALPALLEDARGQRPELRAAAENVAAHAALLDLERAKYYPDLAVIGGFTFADTSNASDPATPFAYDPYHAFGGYVALALRGTFDIPQKLARVRQVEADLHEALATQVGAERLVRLDIETALGDLASARGRAEHYISGSAKAKKLLVKGAVAFDSGLGQAFDLLLDTLLYSRAEGERLKALLDAQLAWASLERAVGGPLVQTPSQMTPAAAATGTAAAPATVESTSAATPAADAPANPTAAPVNNPPADASKKTSKPKR